MSETNFETGPEALLHAYHDGELSGLARRRFERTLRRSPELRRRLEDLGALRESIRRSDADGESPDLWDAIALRLPAIDAQRAEAASVRSGGFSFGSWLKPMGATAAALGVALAVWLWPQPPAPMPVVRWIDGGGRNVMVLDGTADTTIIWVLDERVDGAAMGERRGMV